MTTERRPVNIEAAIAAAVAAVGPCKGDVDRRMQVEAILPSIVAMMTEGSWQWKTAEAVAEADVFVGTYLGHELEETSKRLVVSIEARGDTEQIRTHRTDTSAGRAQEHQLKSLEPGQECAWWKHIDVVNDTTKVRTLVHFEPMRRKNVQQAAASSDGHAAAPAGREREQGASDEPAADSEPAATPPPGDTIAVAKRAYNELDDLTKQRVNELRAERGHGKIETTRDANQLIAVIDEVCG